MWDAFFTSFLLYWTSRFFPKEVYTRMKDFGPPGVSVITFIVDRFIIYYYFYFLFFLILFFFNYFCFRRTTKQFWQNCIPKSVSVFLKQNTNMSQWTTKTYNKTCATSEVSDQPAHRMYLLQPPRYPKRVNENHCLTWWSESLLVTRVSS